jgi:hypothetical protein
MDARLFELRCVFTGDMLVAACLPQYLEIANRPLTAATLLDCSADERFIASFFCA